MPSPSLAAVPFWCCCSDASPCEPPPSPPLPASAAAAAHDSRNASGSVTTVEPKCSTSPRAFYPKHFLSVALWPHVHRLHKNHAAPTQSLVEMAPAAAAAAAAASFCRAFLAAFTALVSCVPAQMLWCAVPAGDPTLYTQHPVHHAARIPSGGRSQRLQPAHVVDHGHG